MSATNDLHQIAVSMPAYLLNFPENIQLLLSKYIDTEDSSILNEIAIYAARSCFLDVEHQVVLIAILIQNNLLKIEEATILLPQNNQDNCELPDPIRHVIDIAWLLRQDHQDNLMEPEDDDLLYKALADVVKLNKLPKSH